MGIQEFRFDANQILQPAYPSPLNRLDPAAFGASLTITRGLAMGRKTSDGKLYPLNLAAADGTQVFAGFAQYTGSTDASGNFFIGYGGATAPNYFAVASSYSNVYTGGIFNPLDLATAPTGSPVAEVDTLTPANPTTGDIFYVNLPGGGGQVSFTIGATQTAAAAVTGLKAAWAANPTAAALAAASGTATLILTAAAAGRAMNLASGVIGTGTLTKAVTTPATDAQQAEVDTFTLGGTVTTGDVYTATVTTGGGQTFTVSFTATAGTVANVTAGLVAAWNASGQALNYAAPSSTSTTFVLTGAYPGQSLNVALATTGSGTVSKAVTSPAYGANIADVLPGCPGARVLAATGFWELP